MSDSNFLAKNCLQRHYKIFQANFNSTNSMK